MGQFLTDEELDRVWNLVYNAIGKLSQDLTSLKITANFEAHSLEIISDFHNTLHNGDAKSQIEAVFNAKTSLFELCVAELTYHMKMKNPQFSVLTEVVQQLHATLFPDAFMEKYEALTSKAATPQKKPADEGSADSTQLSTSTDDQMTRTRCNTLTFDLENPNPLTQLSTEGTEMLEKPQTPGLFNLASQGLVQTSVGDKTITLNPCVDRVISGHLSERSLSFRGGRISGEKSVIGATIEQKEEEDPEEETTVAAAHKPLFNFKNDPMTMFGVLVPRPTGRRLLRVLANFFRISTWLPHYDWRADLKMDLIAGVTVGLLLISQALAYTLLAGLPINMGLYASLVGLITYAIFGTSRQLGAGPSAIVALVVGTGIFTDDMGVENDTATRVALAGAMAFIGGQIQFWLGNFGFGFLVNFLSQPVISGFTSGAAILIGLSQLKYVLGYEIKGGAFPLQQLGSLFKDIHLLNWVPLVITICCIIVLAAFKQINPKIQKKIGFPIPAPILLFIILIPITWATDLKGRYHLKVLEDIPQGLPPFQFPDLAVYSGKMAASSGKLLSASISAAFISFIEAYSVASKFAIKNKYQLDPGQELRALGLMNFFVSMFTGYHSSGGFSRTAVNESVGMRTQLCALISAVVLIITLLFLTPLLYYLPTSALASIILVAVFSLIDTAEAKHCYKVYRSDFFCLLMAFASTVAFGAVYGILISATLSLLLVLMKTVRPKLTKLARVPGTVIFRPIKFFPECLLDQCGFVVRLDADLYFVNGNYLKQKLGKKEKNHREMHNGLLNYVVLDGRGINSIDTSGVRTLFQIYDRYEALGIVFAGSNFNDTVRNTLKKGDDKDRLSKQKFFFDREYEAIVFCYSVMKSRISTSLDAPDRSVPWEVSETYLSNYKFTRNDRRRRLVSRVYEPMALLKDSSIVGSETDTVALNDGEQGGSSGHTHHVQQFETIVEERRESLLEQPGQQRPASKFAGLAPSSYSRVPMCDDVVDKPAAAAATSPYPVTPSEATLVGGDATPVTPASERKSLLAAAATTAAAVVGDVDDDLIVSVGDDE